MDLTKELFDIALGVVNLLLIALGTVLWSAQQDAKKAAAQAISDLTEHKLYCARNYVTQEGLTTAIKNLEATIGSLVQAVKDNMQETRQGFKDLYGKVDTKQDKS